jgi:hypothetical protein
MNVGFHDGGVDAQAPPADDAAFTSRATSRASTSLARARQKLSHRISVLASGTRSPSIRQGAVDQLPRTSR